MKLKLDLLNLMKSQEQDEFNLVGFKEEERLSQTTKRIAVIATSPKHKASALEFPKPSMPKRRTNSQQNLTTRNMSKRKEFDYFAPSWSQRQQEQRCVSNDRKASFGEPESSQRRESFVSLKCERQLLPDIVILQPDSNQSRTVAKKEEDRLDDCLNSEIAAYEQLSEGGSAKGYHTQRHAPKRFVPSDSQ